MKRSPDEKTTREQMGHRTLRPTRAVIVLVALGAVALAAIAVVASVTASAPLALSTPPPFATPASTPRPTVPATRTFFTTLPRVTATSSPRPTDNGAGVVSPEDLLRTTAGTMALDAPSRIKQGATPVVITVRVAPGSAVPTASLGPRASISPTTVSPLMDAQLTGSAFDIEPLPGNGPQIVGDAATWQWRVSSTKAGRHSLQLTTLIVVAVSGVATTKKLQADTREIDVDVDPLWQVADFGEKNWQWLLTAAALPVIGWLWRRRGQDKEQKRQPRSRRQ
jgi:hypothetical protein